MASSSSSSSSSHSHTLDEHKKAVLDVVERVSMPMLINSSLFRLSARKHAYPTNHSLADISCTSSLASIVDEELALDWKRHHHKQEEHLETGEDPHHHDPMSSLCEVDVVREVIRLLKTRAFDVEKTLEIIRSSEVERQGTEFSDAFSHPVSAMRISWLTSHFSLPFPFVFVFDSLLLSVPCLAFSLSVSVTAISVSCSFYDH